MDYTYFSKYIRELLEKCWIGYKILESQNIVQDVQRHIFQILDRVYFNYFPIVSLDLSDKNLNKINQSFMIGDLVEFVNRDGILLITVLNEKYDRGSKTNKKVKIGYVGTAYDSNKKKWRRVSGTDSITKFKYSSLDKLSYVYDKLIGI